MAKTETDPQATAQLQTKPAKPEAKPEEPAQAAFNPAKATLPELLGHLVQTCLANRAAVPQARRDLYVWYHAQPLDQRKETAKLLREAMETTKQVGEALFQSGIELWVGDI